MAKNKKQKQYMIEGIITNQKVPTCNRGLENCFDRKYANVFCDCKIKKPR
jgi:hypothetical protein